MVSILLNSPIPTSSTNYVISTVIPLTLFAIKRSSPVSVTLESILAHHNLFESEE